MAYWTILGEGLDGGTNGKHFGVTLDTDRNTWIAGGSSVDLFFNTKSGNFDLAGIPESGTQLLSSSSSEVAFFSGLLGSNSIGASGRGRASEKGVNFNWLLESK